MTRRKLSPTEHIYLVTEVDRVCPRCGVPLFYTKNGTPQKKYQVAHIYPHSPTDHERELLKDEERLSEDSDDVVNLIPLCPSCHAEFDKPRTVDEYRELVQLKRGLIRRAQQQDIQYQYKLEADISRVVEGLSTADLSHAASELEFVAKNLDDKLDDSITVPTALKIKHNVAHFFLFVRSRFAEMESENPNTANLISAQVRAYYFAQKSAGLSQHLVFYSVVEWIRKTIEPEVIESAEIVASFFVQNCEVFE